MPISDLYSKRKRRAVRAGEPEVFRYEPILSPFRVKVVHILNDAIGVVREYSHPQIDQYWKTIHDLIAREKGVFHLGEYGYYYNRACDWFLQVPGTDDALDFIEVSFRLV